MLFGAFGTYFWGFYTLNFGGQITQKLMIAFEMMISFEMVIAFEMMIS